LIVTGTRAAAAVPLRTSTRRSTLSPTRRKRGSAERMSSGFVDTSSFVPSPTIVSPLMARACMRQVVRSSGMATSTVAVPSSFVTSCADQYAVLRKSERVFPLSAPEPAPPLPTRGSSATMSFQRSSDTPIDEFVETARPRSNQNARSPSGPRSSARLSTALSTTATDTSERTPFPLVSVTLIA
jgi:hypothetical protein